MSRKSALVLAHDDGRSVAHRCEADTQTKPEVADLIVAYLEQLGIEYVFGVPGGAIEPLYNALARSARRGGPRPIVARHETGAAFMADGYARETGKIGVCCATAGPGATNLLTGVACAFDNGVPLLVISGQPALPSFGKRALQESTCTGVNTLAMFRHCSHYNSLVSHPKQVESKLISALMRAVRSPQGPAHLTIPLDILRSPSAMPSPSYDLRTLLQQPSMIDADAVAALAREIGEAKRIVVLVGGWCGEAIGTILQFAAVTGAAIVATPDGKGLVSPRHPQFRGVFGFAGHANADATLNDPAVDLIVAVGTSMSEWTSSGWSDTLLNQRLIHIDESEEHLSRSPMARMHVRGRLRAVFQQLIERLRPANGVTGRSVPLALCPAAIEPIEPEAFLAAPDKYHSGAVPITPQRLMRELGRRFPSTTRFLADSGNSVAWAAHYLHPMDRRVGERRQASGERKQEPGRRETSAGWLRVTMDFAPMGWAIGAAVGTASANRAAPVVCITGDGSMLMNGQEISVAVAEGLTVIYVVVNDSALGMVKHGQRLAGAEPIAFELPPTDFAAMARAMGAQGYTIRSPAEFDALDVDALCRHGGPSLIDVYVDAEEVPPMNLRMKILGAAV